MERKELNLNKECKEGGAAGRSDGFIDRSKVRILLCENDADSSKEVFTLLLKCSYQVISVRSPRQVIDALNAEGPDIDIILADLDLPTSKGMKMLKYITRDKDLRRIPIIMMSAQDEISVVVKCLRLGAADYLVKPLRTNELLNLWTHMWRRRRMLGLAEKNILSYEFDIVASDPSDANTNSTTLFSDDTDDKTRRNSNPETGDEETVAASTEHLSDPLDDQFDHGNRDHQAVQFSPGPKRSELKIGGSSAFFTYVKSSIAKNTQPITRLKPNLYQNPALHEKNQVYHNPVGDDVWENYSPGDDLPSSASLPDSVSVERSSCTPPAPRHENDNDYLEERPLPKNDSYPYHMPGVANQAHQNNLHEMQNHATAMMMSQYNHISQCPPQMNGMSSFPYYPLGFCVQPGQMAAPHGWPNYGTSSSNEVTINKVDRREAALIKFRQKRKERCFDKKIRYVNRKRLAERRPRVRGQFVRKVNGVTVDLNGQPASADYDEDEEDDEG